MDKQANAQQVSQLVAQQRKRLPRLGTRKLYHLLRPTLQARGIKLGRDGLFALLKAQGGLIKRRRRYVQTTMSRHWMRRYPNLVKGLLIHSPEQVWVSDITYLRTQEGFCYLNLVTDAYSRKIMGYAVADSMETYKMKKAFVMALHNRQSTGQRIIHHSDRGFQYCSREYAAIAKQAGICFSMTQNGDPYENALAERMNRTLKEELGLGGVLPSKAHAVQLVEEAVYLYNHLRPHLALHMKTPYQVHNEKIPVT